MASFADVNPSVIIEQRGNPVVCLSESRSGKDKVQLGQKFIVGEQLCGVGGGQIA